MILFKRIIPTEVPAPFTKVEAQAIYDLLATEKNPMQLFKEHNVPLRDLKLFIDEIEALEAEVFSKIRGTYLLEEATYDEEGNELTPAVYYEVTTAVALANSLHFVNVPKLSFVTDLLKYYPYYKVDRTWLEFKNAVLNG